jgi:hypothetical protein
VAITLTDKASGNAVVGTNRRGRRILIAVASLGLVLGGGVLGLTTQPKLEAGSAGPEANYWQAVVDYHETKYRAQATPVDRDIAYWRAVVDYYETKYGAHAAPVKAVPVKRDGPGGPLALFN